MIEKIMKAVKSSNKRRGRNITIGAVIGFLLSCTAVMGADSYLWIKEDSGKIQFNKLQLLMMMEVGMMEIHIAIIIGIQVLKPIQTI